MHEPHHAACDLSGLADELTRKQNPDDHRHDSNMTVVCPDAGRGRRRRALRAFGGMVAACGLRGACPALRLCKTHVHAPWRLYV